MSIACMKKIEKCRADITCKQAAVQAKLNISTQYDCRNAACGLKGSRQAALMITDMRCFCIKAGGVPSMTEGL